MADVPPTRHAGGDAVSGADRSSTTGAPRWVKVFGIVILVLVLLVVLLHLTGNSLGGHDAHRGHAPAPGGY
jgi:hypothetical protein